MPQPDQKTLKLPRQLLDEIGASGVDPHNVPKHRKGPGNRKEQRKAKRVEKKTRSIAPKKAPLIRQQHISNYGQDETKSVVSNRQQVVKTTTAHPKKPKSILKVRQTQPPASESPSPPARISRGVKDKLAQDDAEIAALEKALGVKGKTKLPKAFEDDGLESLLEGLDDAGTPGETHPGKRKRDEGEDWLEKKRQKARKADVQDEISDTYSSESFGSEDGESEMESLAEDEGSQDSLSGFEEDERSASSSEGEDLSTPVAVAKRVRENPYVAPVLASTAASSGKYIPPSLRSKDTTPSEDLTQLRRQIQGLLNRLSEANLLAIVGDVEKLYQTHPRQHVSVTLLDLLMGLLADPTTLQDTFIILHAGFIAALYKIIGTDFGAQAVQRIEEEFTQCYRIKGSQETTSKKSTNLMSLLAELCNFQVIGSNLIYDFIRLFLEDLSETNTELLLKAVRNAGPQLRQDDPSSLKAIVLQLQTAIAKAGEENLSVRTKFMVETINKLKNNRMKTGIAASTISSEHTIRMKKTLGTLNQGSIRALEPLRIGLQDLQDTEKRGKWWLVGASYKGEVKEPTGLQDKKQYDEYRNKESRSSSGGAADLAQLAKEQRMNTDVRRSIFIAIMSAADYNDAYMRLMKLRLKKSQELEIPKVLIHCSGAEKIYNPFYTLLSRRVCSDRKLRMAFQFSLWDLFKQMGEGDEGEQDEDDEADGKLELRAVVNLAKMFGALIADGGLGLGVLKVRYV